jgi:hypothetical protein
MSRLPACAAVAHALVRSQDCDGTNGTCMLLNLPLAEVQCSGPAAAVGQAPPFSGCLQPAVQHCLDADFDFFSFGSHDPRVGYVA